MGAFYAVFIGIGYDMLANRYTLTEDEVIEIYGVVQKNRKVTKLEHIRSVSVEIGFIGRIFGFGDVLYYTAGSGGVDVRLKDIGNPEELAAEADRLVRSKKDGRGGSSSSGELSGVDPSGEASHGVLQETLDVQRQILQVLTEMRDAGRNNMPDPGSQFDGGTSYGSAENIEEHDKASEHEEFKPGWATSSAEDFDNEGSEDERSIHRSLL
jgi:hypothetical protein